MCPFTLHQHFHQRERERENTLGKSCRSYTSRAPITMPQKALHYYGKGFNPVEQNPLFSMTHSIILSTISSFLLSLSLFFFSYKVQWKFRNQSGEHLFISRQSTAVVFFFFVNWNLWEGCDLIRFIKSLFLIRGK